MSYCSIIIVLANNSKAINCEMVLIVPINEYLLQPDKLDNVINKILIDDTIFNIIPVNPPKLKLISLQRYKNTKTIII
jgi:predicted CoA-binding protein